jgi:DHA2 family multidrug resistance protein
MEEERWVPKHNPWLIAIVVSMATFMEVLDTSVANVALPHIAGSLGASQDESTWILTSYLVSNAVVLPMAAYFSTLIGRKRFYMLCVALFGVGSLLCGLAPTLPLLLFFRVLQGAGGGGLGPSEQSILADSFAPEKRGQAFALYGMAIILAPTIGPTIGGLITDNFGWRWVFFINLPVVALSLYLTHKLVEDPPAIQKEVKEAKSGHFRIDYVGFALLALTFGTLEVVLDKGQEADWFGSTYITAFAVTALVAFISVIVWELRLARKQQRPILDLSLFGNRTFAVAMAMMFVVGASLYAINTLIVQLLQNLMGYTAEQSGIAQIGGGIATMLCMALVGAISSKIDARKLIAFGFAITAASLFYMGGLNLLMSMHYASLLKFYQGFGIAFLFIPITTMSYVGIPANKNNDVAGMTNLARNIGGSCGTSFLTTVFARHQRHATNGNIFYNNTINTLTQQHMAGGSGKTLAHSQAVQQFYQQLQKQAGVLSYIDVITFFAFACLFMVPFSLLMKKNTSGEVKMH